MHPQDVQLSNEVQELIAQLARAIRRDATKNNLDPYYVSAEINNICAVICDIFDPEQYVTSQ
jgi:hypothetical protein